MQILSQTNLRCRPWLSCSKKPRGQTYQVNRSQTDIVYPQTRPLPSKNTPSLRETVILPNAAGPRWFTASVHSPYKHFHMSSSRPPGGTLKELWSAFQKSIHSTPFNITKHYPCCVNNGISSLLSPECGLNTPLVLSWSTFTVRCECLSYQP